MLLFCFQYQSSLCIFSLNIIVFPFLFMQGHKGAVSTLLSCKDEEDVVAHAVWRQKIGYGVD